ncbi:MAG: hypothetical protein IT410_02110 [Candidatus Doudnabacteria bacterium]|nr:hypothetical protein [Candidatus Doudnabacteria bacterium]
MQRFKTFKYKTWKYQNTTFLLISLVVFFYFADSEFVQNLINQLGSLGYFGAFITGIFFVSTFTVAPAAVVLFHLADHLNPFEVAILAGLGAVVGDYLIFRFFKDKVLTELRPLFENLTGPRISRLLHTPYFAWLLPVIGATIIASPLPDELGVGILGIAKMKPWKFLILSFFLNAMGIFIIVTLAQSI